MSNLTPFLIYAFVTTFTPGPNNILSMTNAVRSGYLRTFKFLLGIFGGFFIVMLLCGFLNIVLAAQLPSLKIWLNIFGALYMLYLAFHILRNKPVEDDPAGAGFNTFKAGFSMQFLNIKVILYGVTVFSLFIVGTYRDPGMITLFSFLLAAMGFIATSCWALGGDLFRGFLRRHYRIFNFVMAGLLIYAAVAGFFNLEEIK